MINEYNLCELNGMWKGDNVGYNSLHEWIRNHKIKSEFCEMCKSNKDTELANISGQYKRDIDDFLWLCRSCHMKFDYKNKMRTPLVVSEEQRQNCSKRMKELLKIKENHPNLRKVGDRLRCGCCKELKSFDSFNDDIRSMHGKHDYCKDCLHEKYIESKNGY